MSVIEEVTGEDKIPEWIHGISDPNVGDILGSREEQHRTVIRYIDFEDSDLPSRHRATVLHSDYNSQATRYRELPDTVVRMEFRIGEKNDGWDIGERFDASALLNSDRYITHIHGDDGTYVSFFLEPPEILKEFVREFQERVEE